MERIPLSDTEFFTVTQEQLITIQGHLSSDHRPDGYAILNNGKVIHKHIHIRSVVYPLGYTPCGHMILEKDVIYPDKEGLTKPLCKSCFPT